MGSTLVIIMGVSGCGKTTVAAAVAESLGGVFLEGDAFHPAANKEKMAAGIPLVDDDRLPWFDVLSTEARKAVAVGKTAVLACSALKRSYREHLFSDFPDGRLVFLEGDYDLIKARMDTREHEYMTSALLRSQFDTLEEPEPSPNTLVLPVTLPPASIIAEILAWLGTD